MISPVRVQFWGTRGSLAKPGQKMIRYGGNTSCVQVTSPGGSLLVIDCGTGAHDLGQSLIANATEPLQGSILISHTHWDHIQGFPFFAPLFVRGSQWDIYGPRGLGQSLQEALAGQMQYTYFPVTLDELGATIRFHDLIEGTFEIDDVRITTRYLNHPALTLGYRLEMGGISVVYACDHEPNVRHPGVREPLHELDRRHSEFLAGADLVIHDAQFTDAEYAGTKGWGHSPAEYVSEMGQIAGVRQMALSHHDPKRTDDELDQIIEAVRADLRQKGSLMKIFAAADGQVVELSTAAGAGAGGVVVPHESTAFPSVPSATHQSSVIIGTADQKLAAMLAEATRPDGVRSTHAADGEAVLKMASAAPPDLLLVDDQLRGIDGLSVCQRLRADRDERLKDVPVVMVADHERTDQGLIAGVTGWLIRPFSTQFARSHIHAWILRSVCRWSRAAVPSDEDNRLAALRELGVLDTPPEERFERITRIAADLAGVPIVLVSLVDENRQWFKSCHGLDVSETSRELSFCAHAVVSREPLIVFDTLLDDRFADNPLVTSGPRIRFYAGFPIFHKGGSCVGTLCLIDTRPRQFSQNLIQRFQDLASIVQKELNSALGRVAD